MWFMCKACCFQKEDMKLEQDISNWKGSRHKCLVKYWAHWKKEGALTRQQQMENYCSYNEELEQEINTRSASFATWPSTGLLVKITATTGIASFLFQGGRKLHSQLGIRVDDKDRSNDSSSSCMSNFYRRPQRAELLRQLVLIIINEASMMERKLFDLVDVYLEDVQCSGSCKHRPQFGVIAVLLDCDYLQLLPVFPSHTRVEEGNGNGLCVDVRLLDELPCFYRL